MAIVDGSLQLGYKDSAWFTANPTLILKQGQIVALEQTGTYKLGDGVTALSALTFLGGGDTVDVNTIGAAINGAASATPNDTDLVISVESSVAKKNTWTQIKVFLKTYFDTVYTTTSAVASQITTALLPYALKESQLNSGGTITIGTFGGSGTNNDIRVSASNWFIQSTGLNYSTSTNTDFLDIPPSAIGEQRFIGLYGTTSNTIIKVEGNEDILATYPIQPANTALIGYVLITDAGASTTPDLSGYLLKSSKATQSTNLTGTNDTTYVTPLANAVKENTNRKSSSFTVSSTTTYPNTKALVDGLATKQNSLGFTPENVANKENTTLDTSTTKYPTNNLVKTNIDAKVTANAAITGATKTKITYDSKGLVTSGADATTADIADSLNKRYVTDANLTVIGNTSGTNTGDQTLSGLGGVPTTRSLTINGTTYDLSADRTWTISTASNVAIKDEGSTLTSAVTSIDFTGSGVTASAAGSAVTVNINSGVAAASNLFNYYNFI